MADDKIRVFPNLAPEYSSEETLREIGLISKVIPGVTTQSTTNGMVYSVNIPAIDGIPEQNVCFRIQDGVAYYCDAGGNDLTETAAMQVSNSIQRLEGFVYGHSKVDLTNDSARTELVNKLERLGLKDPDLEELKSIQGSLWSLTQVQGALPKPEERTSKQKNELALLDARLSKLAEKVLPDLKPFAAIAKKRDADKVPAFIGFAEGLSNLGAFEGVGLLARTISKRDEFPNAVEPTKKVLALINQEMNIYILRNQDKAVYLRLDNETLYHCDEHGNYLNQKEVKEFGCVSSLFKYIQTHRANLNVDKPSAALEDRIKASKKRFAHLPKEGRIQKELEAIESEYTAVDAKQFELGFFESGTIEEIQTLRKAALAARLSALEFDSVLRKIYWKTQAGSIFAASSVGFMVGGAFLLQGEEAEPTNTDDIEIPGDDDTIESDDSDPIMDFFAGDLHLEGLPAALFFAACAFYSNWLVCRPFLMQVLLDRAQKDYLAKPEKDEFTYKAFARESAAILAAIAWAIFAEVAAVELVTALMYGEDKDVGAFGFKAASDGEFFNLENLPGVLGAILGFAATYVLIYYTTFEPMKKIGKNYQTYWENFVERAKENPLWVLAYIVLIGTPLLTGGVMTTLASVTPFEEILGDEIAAWGVCIAGILGISALYFYSAIGVLDSIAKTLKTSGKNIAEYGKEAGLAWGVHFGNGIFTFHRGETSIFRINVLSALVTSVLLLGIATALLGNGIGHGFPAVEGTENFSDDPILEAFIFAGAAFTSIITNIKGVERAPTIADPFKVEVTVTGEKNNEAVNVNVPKNLPHAIGSETSACLSFRETNALKPLTDVRLQRK